MININIFYFFLIFILRQLSHIFCFTYLERSTNIDSKNCICIHKYEEKSLYCFPVVSAGAIIIIGPRDSNELELVLSFAHPAAAPLCANYRYECLRSSKPFEPLVPRKKRSPSYLSAPAACSGNIYDPLNPRFH